MPLRRERCGRIGAGQGWDLTDVAAGGRTIGGGCSPESCCDEGTIDGVA